MTQTEVRNEAIQRRIVRIRDGAQSVLRRLDAAETLTAVLPAAKSVFDEHGDQRVLSRWLEFEIYGLADVPLSKPPLTDPDQKAAGILFSELHTLEDPSSTPTYGSDSLKRDKIDVNPIGDIEGSVDYWNKNEEDMKSLTASMSITDPRGAERQARKWAILARERQRILRRVRSQLYDHVSGLRRWADAEIENIALLGPDYRIVLDSLEALNTGVREELTAAITNLASPNPAEWSLAALACRNVVLAMGRTLWQIKAESYDSELAGKTLDLKGEREVNQLSSFIDYHYRRSDGDNRAMLQQLDELARGIHGRGSAGKQQRKVRHEDAQRLIVDTFYLVAELDKLVGLEPIASLSSPSARTTP